MYMYMYMHICMYIYIYICMYDNGNMASGLHSVRRRVGIGFIHGELGSRVLPCIWYIYIYIYIGYMHMYVYVCVCIYIYIYIYMFGIRERRLRITYLSSPKQGHSTGAELLPARFSRGSPGKLKDSRTIKHINELTTNT